jgi:hypothetical protein
MAGYLEIRVIFDAVQYALAGMTLGHRPSTRRLSGDRIHGAPRAYERGQRAIGALLIQDRKFFPQISGYFSIIESGDTFQSAALALSTT